MEKDRLLAEQEKYQKLRTQAASTLYVNNTRGGEESALLLCGSSRW